MNLAPSYACLRRPIGRSLPSLRPVLVCSKFIQFETLPWSCECLAALTVVTAAQSRQSAGESLPRRLALLVTVPSPTCTSPEQVLTLHACGMPTQMIASTQQALNKKKDHVIKQSQIQSSQYASPPSSLSCARDYSTQQARNQALTHRTRTRLLV